MDLSLFKDKNHEWINSPEGKESYLSGYAQLYKGNFIETSCEVTAHMLRDHFAGTWQLLDKVPTDKSLYQISIGPEWSEIEHILTVYNSYIIDSWAFKYTIRCQQIPKDAILDLNFFQRLYNQEFPDCELFYWSNYLSQ